MKHLILSIIALALINYGFAQTTGSTSMGPGYANQVYYNLDNGDVKSSIRNSWDIAFDVSGFGYGILINDGNNTNLYKYNGGLNDYATLDTTGLASWALAYNSDSSWSEGAFNRITNGTSTDLGWGEYSTITHTMVGTNIYVIELSDGTFKKIIIESLVSGIYRFKYADIDGANEVATTITKSDYEDRNYAYYSIINGEELDLEPENDSWDIVFTKFVTSNYNGTPNQVVTGVLVNKGIAVSKVTGIPADEVTFDDTTNFPFSTTISEIGWDWKKLNYTTFAWEITDSLSYIIKREDGSIFHLAFTDFGGSSNGNIEFTIAKDVALSTNNFINNNQLEVYPTVLTQGQSIHIQNEGTSEATSINLYNTNGETVITTPFVNTLNTSNLASGMYHLSVQFADGVINQKVIIQ